MLQNYLLIAFIITIAWALLLGGYLLLSARQRKLEKELEELQRQLDMNTKEEEA